MAQDTVASHALQALLRVGGAAWWHRLHAALQGSLGAMARHATANFVLQQLCAAPPMLRSSTPRGPPPTPKPATPPRDALARLKLRAPPFFLAFALRRLESTPHADQLMRCMQELDVAQPVQRAASSLPEQRPCPGAPRGHAAPMRLAARP